MEERRQGQGEKFVRWPTMDQNMCWSNKHSETIKDAMIDMLLLLRGVWRFQSDEGREFVGAVDGWLREHAVLHTTTGAYDPNATVLSKRVLVLGSVVFDLSCTKQMRLCVSDLMQRNTRTKSTSTANDECLDRAT